MKTKTNICKMDSNSESESDLDYDPELECDKRLLKKFNIDSRELILMYPMTKDCHEHYYHLPTKSIYSRSMKTDKWTENTKRLSDFFSEFINKQHK